MPSSFFSRLAGTLLNTFRIGSAKFNVNNGVVEVQDASDNTLIDVKVSGIQITSGAGDGYVAYCDSVGSLYWAEAPAGGGGSSDAFSWDLAVDLDNVTTANIATYDSSPSAYPAGLGTWDSTIQTALCLALRIFAEGVSVSHVTSLNGDTDIKSIAGQTAEALAITSLMTVSTETLSRLAYAISGAILNVNVASNLSLSDKIAAMNAATTLDCIVELMYSNISSSKPSESDFEGSLSTAGFINNAEYAKQVAEATLTQRGLFVTFLDTLLEAKAAAVDGTITNDCDGDYSACVWSHTIDFTASDGGFVVWAAAPRGTYTSGVGWENSNAGIRLWRQIPRAHVNTITFNFTTVGNPSSEAFSIRAHQHNGTWDGDAPRYYFVSFHIPGSATSSFTLDVNDSIDAFNVYTSFNSADMTITSVELTGGGDNPFI